MVTDLMHRQVVGYRRPPFWLNWWSWIDIDDDVASPS